VITLLDPTGNGSKYKRYSPYVQVPLGFWREQWIVRLSGSAVALLMVLLDLQGGKKSRQDAPWLPTRQRVRYGLSDDTWTRASKELVEQGLLTIDRIPQGRDFDFRRMRNTYWINKTRLDEIDPDYPYNSLNFPPPPPRRQRRLPYCYQGARPVAAGCDVTGAEGPASKGRQKCVSGRRMRRRSAVGNRPAATCPMLGA
jgi:hypothetical protein